MKATILSLFFLLPSLLLQAQSPVRSAGKQPAGKVNGATPGLALAGVQGNTLSLKILLANPQLTISAPGYLIEGFNCHLKPATKEEPIGPIANKGGQMNETILGIIKGIPLTAGSRIFLDDIRLVHPNGTTVAAGSLSFTLTE